ncbi:MAG: amino acid adenylation domain-containing protein [Bacillota bacterium]|nr:amino acid adenylation domain-containing protein [Bacillota bacterium]
MSNAKNLCDVIENASRKEAGIILINDNGSEKFLPYKDLYDKAKGILYNIKKQGITRENEVVMQIEDNENFIYIFWACILGGIIPVPLHVGINKEQRKQLFNVFKALKDPKLITDKKIYSEIKACVETEKLQDLGEDIIEKSIIIDDIINVVNYDEVYKPLPQDVAYIQFSSGSTGAPKGITITHENIISNVKALYNRMKCNEKDSVLNWLPITHSFSLVVGHITTMAAEIYQYLMPTMLFVKNPILWMEKVNEHKNTILLSPNFGFNHFLKFTDKEICHNWDLSCIKIIITGAEPIDVNLCNEFIEYMNKYGMNKNTICPSYGMTEATVGISSPMLGDQYKSFRLERNSVAYGCKIKEISDINVKNVMNIVSVGYPLDECSVRICNENNNILQEKYIGSIQIKGKNVTRGYYNNETATQMVFTKDGWLKTGDIGFLFNDQLVVTGREKDIIFINGQNYYPIDIERIVKDINGLAFDEVAACGIFNKEKQKEDVVIFVPTKESVEAFASKALSIKRYVNNCTGLEVENIIPVEALPKASSGKIQRFKLIEQYLSGSFDSKIDALSKISINDLSQKIKKPKNKIEESLVGIWSHILKVNNIGVNQSFFELGGDSLKAAFVVHSINKEFNIDISLRDIFNNITIERLSKYISNVEAGSFEDIIPIKEDREYYPLSSAQKRIYALNQLDKNNINYNITQVVAVEGNIDIERVKEAFNTLVKRHEALRTSFKMYDGELVQKINECSEVSFSYKEAVEEDIDGIIESFIAPFDLNKAPLFRASLIKTNNKKYYIILDIHHIISDGISIGILMKEFIQIYSNEKLSEHRLSYRDYAVWQNENINAEKINKQKEYWLNEFKGNIPLLNMPTDFRRPSKQEFNGNSILFKINSEVTSNLKSLSRHTNTTLYMVLMSAFNVLIHKYSKQEEVVIGTVASGRNFDSLKDVIGMFVNTLSIKSKIYTDESFSNYLMRIKEKSLQILENSDYQFDQLIDDLNIKRDLSRNPIFDVMFVMENIDIPNNNAESVKFGIYDYKPKGTKLDLTLKVQEREGEIVCLFQYNTSLFKEETIDRFVQYYLKVLNEIIDSSDKKISDIDILPVKEREKILNVFNATNVNCNMNLTAYEVFQNQVEKTPNNIAVVCGAEKLTYDELNKKANSLARTLIQNGVKNDEIVGLLVERSVYMAIGILAIMKAGGAYLPIDSEYPADRIKYMLQNSSANVLITQKDFKDNIDFSGQVLEIDEFSNYSEDTSNLNTISKSNNIAYVIYTSGSTGKPKGVAIEHRSLVNYITWFTKKANLREKDKTILLSSFAFDLSYTSLYSSLLCGCELHIVSKEEYMDPEKLLNYISSHEITYIKATPSLLSMLVNTYSFSISDKCKSIRLIVLGGEPINVTLVEKYNKIYPNTQVMNHYGPTECTIGCIAALIDINNLNQYKKCPVIGKPIDNVKVYLLDDNMKPVAIGQTGEIYIGGPGLTRGYLEREDLNKEKFIENSFDSKVTDRLFKTGDLGRYLEDGSIEFLGRKDNQVKVRGYRIELGEIENSILKYQSIDKAAVIDIEDEDGNKEICAYFVSKEDLPIYDLRKYLGNKLPIYMIPAYFVKVDEIPLTSNGKINRNALPKPKKNIISNVVYEEPQNDTEIKIAKIWSEVLGLEKIGVNYNFFEIGGHSLRATVLISKVQKEFNILIEMKDIFENPTIKELGKCLNSKDQTDFCNIKAADKQLYYPVSSSQKRLYTLAQIDRESINYNMPSAFIIEGDLDQKRLEDSLFKLINRHEVLRTSFHVVSGETVQKIHDRVEVKVSYDNSGDSIEHIIKDFVKPFSLNTLPIFRIKLVKVKQNIHVLLMDMHHIIFDGVSISVFINEFSDLYNGKELRELKIQYKDYTVWQQELINSNEINNQEQYWLNSFSNELPKLTLPLDYKRPKIQSFEGDSIIFEVDSTMTQMLKNINRNAGTTLFMLLFGAYSILLSKYSLQEDIIVGTAEAGRHHADLQNIIGSFINTVPIRTYPCGDKTFKQYFEEVKSTCFDAFKNSDYQFDKLLEKLNIKRELGRSPLFDTMFILENVDSSELKFEGLTFKSYELKNTVSKFDLMLIGEEIDDKIKFQFKYCTKLFKDKTVEKLKDSYINILREMITNYEKKICEIEYINLKEKSKILYSFNNTNAYYPKDKTIAQIFEQQAVLSPEKTAVVFEDNSISYSELDRRSNSIARMLIEKGICKDSIVGIMIKRSVNMMVGILGILKAGGAYMPISDEYPDNRILYMMEDSGAKVLLTEKCLVDKVGYLKNTVFIDNEDIYNNYSNERVEIKQDSSSLAYVIYTSGTTGKPKGVMLENKSVVNLISSLYDKVYKKYNEKLNIALIAPYIFDASVKQIFASLLLGHTLHIIPEEARVDGEMLISYYIKNKIDISDGTPIHLSILSDCSSEQLNRINVKNFIIGGEALRNSTVISFLSKFSNDNSPNIVNVYGPTECCVDATLYVINKENMNEDILIGEPLNNVKLYVLDKYNKIVPIGIQGELFISGAGVARGYLGQPELTKAKFVKDLFNEEMRMYRTGDLVKWTEQGSIKYIDRIDNQVKIRGFRIELGEIEKQLLKHNEIDEAVVIARENEFDNKYLCAYVTSASNISIDELRHHLSKELPEYMIPSYFIQLDKMPTTINGKVDRKQLPEPDSAYIEAEIEIELPENEIQEILVRVWCEVLGLQNVGINSNYYSLGGDSIKAIQISSKLREYNLKIEIKDLLQYQTIKELSSYVKYTSKKTSQETITGPIKLTPIQKAFFETNYYIEKHYNQSIMLYSKNGFKEDFVEKVFNEIVRHHDALRMVFKKENSDIIQFNRNDDIELLNYNIFHVKDEDYKGYIERKVSEIQSSMDIENGPLIRVGLFKTCAGDHLLIAIHHLVIDGVSWRILLEDFAMAYKQLEEKQNIVLPSKTDSYKKWAEELYNYAESNELQEQLTYWNTIENQNILPIMKDSKLCCSKKIGDCKTISISLDEEYTEKLLRETNKAYNTEINDILLTALAKTIKFWTSNEQVLINLEGHGRENIAEDLDVSRTVGWFTSKYPVLLNVGGCYDLSSEIKNVKETLRHVPLKGIGYSILRYVTLPMKNNDIRFKLEPEISFNYLGQFDNDIKSDLFITSSISSGDNVSKENSFNYSLAVGGMIIRNKLVMKFTYNSKEFFKKTMDNLLNSYIRNLKEIIEHCSIKQEQEYTPSDFDDDNLSFSELEDLNELIKDIEL